MNQSKPNSKTIYSPPSEGKATGRRDSGNGGGGGSVKSPILLKEMQLFLDECRRTHEPVWVVALTKEGELRRYDGWQVLSGWWKKGTHDLLNPRSGQKRKVRDVLIFELNNHPVYI